MSNFKPNLPYDVPFYVLTPTTEVVKGVPKKTYSKDPTIFYCSFRTFGGTETTVNGITVVEDTATLETWYDPLIKANCQIEVDGQIYEILGTPENINKRNQYLVLKVRSIKGGA